MDPDADFSSLTPLGGGWSGETFLGRAGEEQTVVRVYAQRATRGALGAEIDAALLRLVRGLLPVPDVLEVHPADPGAGRPSLLVTSFVPGVRGDLVLPTLGDEGQAAVGRAVGDLAAVLGAMPMPAAGAFVDATLRIEPFGAPGSETDGLPEYVESRAEELAHLSVEELTGLREVALDAEALLDTVTRHCLVHSDLNPKNLLLDPETLTVTALVDWEFAHAGHPFTDLGNVLRFDREPAYVEAVLHRYVERHSVEPAAALPLARAADLWALVDLACRRHEGPVGARADRLLRQVARRRDPGAGEPSSS